MQFQTVKVKYKTVQFEFKYKTTYICTFDESMQIYRVRQINCSSVQERWHNHVMEMSVRNHRKMNKDFLKLLSKGLFPKSPR